MCSFLVHMLSQLLQQEFPINELYLMAGGEILKFCRSSWALTCFWRGKRNCSSQGGGVCSHRASALTGLQQSATSWVHHCVVELANVVLRPATIPASGTFSSSQAAPAPLLTLHWHHLVLQSLHLVYVVGCYPYLLVNLATTLRVQQVSCRWISALLVDSWMLSSSRLSLVSSRSYLDFISIYTPGP